MTECVFVGNVDDNQITEYDFISIKAIAFFMCCYYCVGSYLYTIVIFGHKETLNATNLLLVGATEAGSQQKSWWSPIGLCRINWHTWHNYGVSHEEDLSISAIGSFNIVFNPSFLVPDYSSNYEEG